MNIRNYKNIINSFIAKLRFRKMRFGKSNAFTTVEIVVVMAIAAVLIAIATGGVMAAKRSAIENKHKNNAKKLQIALANYYAEHSTFSWPPPNPCADSNCTSFVGGWRTFKELAKELNNLGYRVQLEDSCGTGNTGGGVYGLPWVPEGGGVVDVYSAVNPGKPEVKNREAYEIVPADYSCTKALPANSTTGLYWGCLTCHMCYLGKCTLSWGCPANTSNCSSWGGCQGCVSVGFTSSAQILQSPLNY